MKSFTLKSLRRNKKRTVVTIIGVIISAAMITAVAGFFTSFLNLLQRDAIESSGNWHAVIKDVNAEDFDTVIYDTAVDQAVLGKDLGYSVLRTSENKYKQYIYLRQYTKSGFDRMSVRLVSGRLPTALNEVAISESIGKSAGIKYRIGDTLDLELGRRETLDGRVIADNQSLYYEMDDNGNQTIGERIVTESTRSFIVVGVIARPTFEYSWSAGCGAVGYLDETAFSPYDAADIYLTASKLDRSIFNTIPALAEKAGKTADDVEFNTNLLRDYGVVENDNLHEFLTGFALVLIVIIIIASVSLIYNAFAISVAERSKQLGLLSSVGATRRQKRNSVFFEGFFIGVIGIPLGILAGYGGMAVTLAAIAPLLKSVINTSSDVTLTLVVTPLSIVAAVVLSALTIFISAYIPARRASRITPIDAIRQTEEVRLTRKAVKTSRLTRKVFGFEADVALKNLKRSRKKYRATVFSLVVSLVLFLTVSTYASMAGTLSGATYDGYNYDIGVTYSNNMMDRADMNDRIAALDLVESHTETANVSGTVRLEAKQVSEYTRRFQQPIQDGLYDLGMTLASVDDDTFISYAQTVGADAEEFYDIEEPRGILINHAQDYYTEDGKYLKKLSGDVLNLREGDTLAFAAADGDDASAKTTELAVGAVTYERPMGTLIQSFYASTLVVTEAVFNAVTNDFTEDQTRSIQHAIYLSTGDDQRLERQLGELTQGTEEISIHNIRSAARAERNISVFLGVFVYGFIILISVICIANIFNTVSTNIALRRKEFAMLRSVGMTPKSFNRMIRFESIFYGLKGLLYGLPISVAIAFLLHNMQQSVLSTPFTLAWHSYAFAILMILVIVFATMLYATKTIKKENIINALKEDGF